MSSQSDFEYQLDTLAYKRDVDGYISLLRSVRGRRCADRSFMIKHMTKEEIKLYRYLFNREAQTRLALDTPKYRDMSREIYLGRLTNAAIISRRKVMKNGGGNV